MKDLLLAFVSVIASFSLVFLFIFLGWFIVWKLILCRFRFFRELVKGPSDSTSTVNELKTSRSKVKKIRRD